MSDFFILKSRFGSGRSPSFNKEFNNIVEFDYLDAIWVEDMYAILSCRRRVILSSCLVLASALCVAMEARGQDSHLPFVAAPPPMKFVPRSERTQLAGERDVKARTREAIELAEARLRHGRISHIAASIFGILFGASPRHYADGHYDRWGYWHANRPGYYDGRGYWHPY